MSNNTLAAALWPFLARYIIRAGTTLPMLTSGGMVRHEAVSLGAGTASVTFSSIPTDYAHLVLWWQARGENASTSVALLLRFNGDTGANYDHSFNQVANSANAATTATAQTSMRLGTFAGASAAAGLSGGGVISIPNYAGTSFQKEVTQTCKLRIGTGAADVIAETGGGDWRSTSAVTSITLLPSATNFAANSLFILYGVY